MEITIIMQILPNYCQVRPNPSSGLAHRLQKCTCRSYSPRKSPLAVYLQQRYSVSLINTCYVMCLCERREVCGHLPGVLFHRFCRCHRKISELHLGGTTGDIWATPTPSKELPPILHQASEAGYWYRPPVSYKLLLHGYRTAFWPLG